MSDLAAVTHRVRIHVKNRAAEIGVEEREREREKEE